MDAKGRCQRARGEEQGNHRLTEVQVRAIRRRYIFRSRGPNGGPALALEFGVSRSTIERIVSRKMWKHI
jgi:hypothetical protein